jgi:hypothetical protein
MVMGQKKRGQKGFAWTGAEAAVLKAAAPRARDRTRAESREIFIMFSFREWTILA